MLKENCETFIRLNEYLDGETDGYEYAERREVDVCDANAVFTLDDGDPVELYIDIEKYDEHCLKKLTELRNKAEKTKSPSDVEAYELYANNIFRDKHDLIISVQWILTIEKSKEAFSEAGRKFEYVKSNYSEIWEHYSSAKKLWFGLKRSSSEMSDKEKNG